MALIRFVYKTANLWKALPNHYRSVADFNTLRKLILFCSSA